MGTASSPPPELIRAQLGRILASKQFRTSELQKQFLTFVVSQTLEGKAAEIKEYVVGTEAFSRGVDFDPRVDSVVRVVARRVRERLAEFYRHEGRNDCLVIEVPAGSYVPSFSIRKVDITLEKEAESCSRAPSSQASLSSIRPLDGTNGSAPDRMNGITEEKLQEDWPIAGLSDILDKPEGALDGDQGRSAPQSTQSPLREVLVSRWTWVVLFVIASGFAATYLLRQPTPPVKIVAFKRLTSDGQGKVHSFSFGVPTPLLSDGSRVYFQEVTGSRVQITQVSASGGETVSLLNGAKQPLILMDMSPDRSELLVRDFFGDTPDRPLLRVSLPDGTPRPVGHLIGHDAAWSADGNRICYAKGSQLYVAKSDGSDSRLLASLPGPPTWPRWSLDGKRIRFTVRDDIGTTSLWEVAIASAKPQVLLKGWNPHPGECCGDWSADGNYYVFQSTRDGSTGLWAIRERSWPFPESTPVRLTEGPLNVYAPSFGSDSRRIYAIVQQRRGELVRYDPGLGSFNLFLGGISADHVEFSRDSQWIAYSSFPEGTIWRSRPDGSERLQLSSEHMSALFPRWSPDGQRIAFMASRPGSAVRIYVVQANGSEPEALLADESPEIDPNWSPDGNSIMFAKLPSVNEIGLGRPAIFTIDLRTHQVTSLPGPDGLTAPRWSPDGRYVVATALSAGHWGSPAVRIYDFTTGKWTGFETEPIDNKWWSADGEYFYFDRYMDSDPAIYRLRMSDRKMKRVTSIKDVRRSFSDMGWWMGLTPDGSPMVLRDTSIEEIYALELSGR